MVSRVHDEPVGHEQEVELATLGVLGDLLDDRQVVVAGRRAVVTPSGGVIAGAEHEHAEVHLTPPRRHGPLPSGAGRRSSPLGDNLPLAAHLWSVQVDTIPGSGRLPAVWSGPWHD